MKNGLPRNFVHWLAQTPDGFLWAATGLGLTRFDGTRFKTLDPTSTPALGDARIKSLCVDPGGMLWVLGENGAIARRERRGFSEWTVERGLPAKGGHGLYSDGAKLFVVSDGDGRVFRLEGNRLVEWLDTRTAASGAFVGINVDFDGTVWVRHGNTLNWWNGMAWQRVNGPDGSTNFMALKTGPSYAGGMWISSSNELRRLRRGEWEQRFFVYETPVHSIQAVMEDRAGNVWVAYAGHLLRFDPSGRLTQSRAHQASADDAVKHFFEDTDGNLWLAMNTGLTRLRPKTKARASRGETAALNPVLDDVLADGRSLAPLPSSSRDDTFVLPAGAKVIEFRFTGVTFDAPERVQFRHKLEGVDTDWSTGARRVASYTNLSPGRYYFRLTAAHNGSALSSRELTASINVQPRYWQTWWFRASGVGVVIGAILVVLQRREVSRRLAQAQQDQFYRRLIESQETERQRIAQELHDSLGQNLLLIKNRAVMGLKDNASQEKMRDQLREISLASADSVEEIRAIARALRPYQLDRLGLTKTLEDVAASVTTAGGLRLEAQVDNVDGLFAPEAEIGLYRIVQEGLNNVLKHSEAKSAHLTVRRNGESVQVDLADDGCGFDPGQKDGFGLTSLRERVRLLGGTLTVKSAPAQGTRLQVTIPLPDGSSPAPATPP